MIRLLSVYRYCTMGGVEAGLRSRMETLTRHDVEAHGFFLRDYGGRNAFNHLSDRIFFGTTEDAFTHHLRQHAYDCVSVIDSFDVLDWIDRSGFSGKVIVELRSTYEHTLVQLKRIGDHRVDALLVPSRFQAENVRRYLPRKVRDGVPCHVAPNFIDETRFCRRPIADIRIDRRIVGWVGRMDPLKNWPEFLAIANRLANRQDVEFWMAGGGASESDQRAALRKALAHTTIAPKLRWWPLVSAEKMPVFYNLVSDSGGVVVLTSKNESFGFAAAEAMACGCPLVAANVGAMPEIIEPETSGLLYESGDADEAARMISRLLDDTVTREEIAGNAVRRIASSFSTEQGAAGFARAVRLVTEEAADSGLPDQIVNTDTRG